MISRRAATEEMKSNFLLAQWNDWQGSVGSGAFELEFWLRLLVSELRNQVW